VKILLDHCVPKRFRQLLVGHEVRTAFEMGWSVLKNGELLRTAASGGFDVFVTVDQNLQYQQNLSTLPLSVVILVAPDNRFDTVRRFAPEVLTTAASLPPRTLVRIDDPANNPPAPPPP
jgi:hypothetical protein